VPDNVGSAAKKLGIRPGASLAIVGMPLDQALALLGELPPDVVVDQDADAKADVVVLFADDLQAVRSQAVPAYQRVAPGGRFWIAYRKGSTRRSPAASPAVEPLHRDTLHRTLTEYGLTGVTLIAIDTSWSAMRFRPTPAQT
jgi:hypothetical protein